MNPKICRVEVQRDHLVKVSTAQPDKALAELIWNALDADATTVEVLLKDSEFGTSEIIVRDNGTGFSFNEAESLFRSLGGSWKAKKDRTEGGRFLHGQEGQGRFKAFALGRCVEWHVIRDKAFKLTALADNLEQFTLEEIPKQEKPLFTTIVTVTELKRDFHILDAETAIEKLLPIFSLYLITYPNVSVIIGGIKLNADSTIDKTFTIALNETVYQNVSYPVELKIIEWSHSSEKELWYCTENGFPLEKYHKQIRSIGDFRFSAYLKSKLISVLSSEGTIGLGELNTHLRDVSDQAIKSIKEYFTKRTLEEGQSQIRKWKSEDIYPFKTEAITPIEVAERQVFDIVAVKLAENLSSLDQADKKSKSFQLRMLKHAVENSPEDLQTVITEVLNLPENKLEELSELLQDVSLASLISASKLVSDRLKLLSGLEYLLFDSEAKNNLKERSQLHRIIARNSWLFGQEYSVSVNDQSLTEVLRKHQKKFGINTPIDEPVTKIDGSKGIVDLMLSRAIPCNRDDEIEHLIVELKAPKIKIRSAECTQIQDYAFAVVEDERFSSLKATWNFWVISNEMDSFAKRSTNQDGRSKGILAQTFENGVKVTIWVKEWSQIIKENKHRLKFLQDKLNYSVDRQQGIKHLREVYAEFTKGVIVENEAAEVAA